MSVWSMPSGAMVQTHESFTHRFAPTGWSCTGPRAPVVARGVMT
jgi:1,5-anhydro-D-fructose reductase (1,5-anhydro-D-mannitol-forming)